MSRYVVTSGSYFEPFSYEELVRPIQQMTEAQNAAQENYDKLSMEASALRNYISDNPEDSQAKALYDNYAAKLSTLQNNLWERGYNAGTVRDLNAARSAYASDITRLANAIQARQQRSDEYWKTRHEHPDMIMGTDPGLSGLNNYLNDDNYGKNYYSYSGDQFMKEVGTDAQARANELMRNPQVMNDPRLAGYITRITQQGFTSQEVANASEAVSAAINGDNSAYNRLDPASKILADVLSSHLESSGARGNVTPEEFNRLFEYGRAGLAQAIGKTDIRDLSDKVWDYNKQLSLMREQHNLSSQPSADSSATGQSPTQPTGGNYTLNDISSFLKAKGYKELSNSLNKNFIKPFQNPIPTSDGGVIANVSDANRILSGLGKGAIMNVFRGIDPDTPSARNGEVISGGVPVTVRVRRNRDYRTSLSVPGFAVETLDSNGKWSVNSQLTEQYNTMYREYHDNLKNWRKQNPDVNLRDLAITEKDRQNIYKEANIPDDIPIEYAPYIMATREKIGRVTPATIAGPTLDNESTRENYALLIRNAYDSSPKDKKGNLFKSDENAFYPVDGYEISDVGETDIKKVLGTHMEGKQEVPNTNSIREITVLPEDLVRNKVRINANGSWYAINPAMLGNDMDSQIQKMRVPVTEMMLPILDPVSAVRMNEEEAAQWIYYTSSILRDYISLIGRDASGNTVAITPRDIVTNEELQSQLREAVTMFMNKGIADARDEMMQRNMQVRGNTAAHPVSYNN